MRDDSIENERWQTCWRNHTTAFHQTAVNAHLIRFWPSLALAPSDRVFVPLCGKSLDLMWLHQLGHLVSGVELSPIAVRALFKESRLQAKRTKRPLFTDWENTRLHIYCGDFFDLTANDLLGVKALYDQAALTALPDDIRIRYVEHLAKILPADCVLMLLTLEDIEDGESDAAAGAISPEIQRLYQGGYTLTMPLVEFFVDHADLLDDAPGQRCVRKVYILTPHPAN